jgi:hypothetical protein
MENESALLSVPQDQQVRTTDGQSNSALSHHFSTRRSWVPSLVESKTLDQK